MRFERVGWQPADSRNRLSGLVLALALKAAHSPAQWRKYCAAAVEQR